MEPAPKRPWLPEDVIAALSLLVIVVITFANVIVRYFTEFSFAWTEDFSILAMSVMVFAGAASATLGDRHIRIEILYAKHRASLLHLSRIALAFAFAALAIMLAKIAYEEWRWGELFSILDLPRWWSTAPLALLSGTLSLRSLGLSWRRKHT